MAGAVLAVQALRRHPRWASWLWQLPLLGPRLRTLALARLYRSLGLLLAAGIPLTAALQLSAAVLPLALRTAVQRTRDDVLAGQALSQALQAQQLATPVALRMLRVGEGSGQTAALLQQAAAFHDEEAQQLADLVARTVNPLLMLLIGAVIGTVVVLMYLPIFSLMEQVA
jgi:general secretion pathway protein F